VTTPKKSPEAEAIAKVTPAVRRALKQQHLTAGKLNRRMAQLIEQHPDINSWDEQRIARRFPDLVRLMERAARAQARAAKATRDAARVLRGIPGLAIPRIRTEELDPAEARCEVCGCGTFTPCAAGCSWEPDFWRRNRAVCTSCTAQAVP
jgi:hypothetical protein